MAGRIAGEEMRGRARGPAAARVRAHARPGELAGLRARVRGELREDLAGRLAYAVDASNHRVLPRAVLVAADEDDVHEALDHCREHGLALTMRGAGSGMAGQALGRGLVVDCSRLRRVLELDARRRLVRVQPGVVQAELDRLVGGHGLCLGPDTASAGRATIGGMVANDSAGMRSVVYGRTSHRVRRLRVLLADGTVQWLGPTSRRALCGPWREVVAVHDRCAGEIERRWPRLLRCVDGYNLPALAGEEPHLARLLCGSEGTLAITLEVELELDPLPVRRAWTVLALRGPDGVGELARAAVLGGASAVELLDAPALAGDPVARELAPGSTTILLVEHSGDEDRIAQARRELADAAGSAPRREVDAPEQAAAVVALRRRLLALTSRPVGQRRPVNVGEDGAVPPERIEEYLRSLRRLLAREGTETAVSGHVSVGCLHTQPLLDLRSAADRARLRRIAEACARLTASLGGAISGEHGDGLSRSELLPLLFGTALCDAFTQVKRALDPDGLLNPGRIVDPWPLDGQLRVPGAAATRARAVAWRRAGPGPAAERRAGPGPDAEACIGVAACRDRLAGTMCPPFRVLGIEESSTRGMANLLREALAGEIPPGDARLERALGLCIACKGCRTECPAGVDMAWLKARHLHAHPPAGAVARLRRRLVAELPALLRLGSRAPALANALPAAPGFDRALALAGLDARRRAPRLAPRTLRTLAAGSPAVAEPDVALFVDTFSDVLEPEIGLAALRYLRAAGARPVLAPNVCCGRADISAGRLDRARRRARENVRRLAPLARAGVPIAGLEPSCVLTLRDEAPRLLDGDPDALAVARASFLAEELLDRWPVPPLRPAEASFLVHPHCHARAAGAAGAPAAALSAIPGASVRTLDAGCCGMAGAFGLRRGSFELSRAIAADRLLPAIAGEPGAVVVAGGTSCRAQLRDLAGIRALHPMQALAGALER
ncbi:MAG TPA: FAD-binding and (Fe-S)-binding domain-containing protein [Solirubrobacteraceae bacterium]|nr:FAD-binding and (Fe-S)-binding domain-containing protein [Solirubrobacteraceae bacterium]